MDSPPKYVKYLGEPHSICMKVLLLTVTLWLGSKPGPIAQAGSLRWTLQRIARLAAEAHNAAHRELLPQADPVHGNTWISAQASRIAWKKIKRLCNSAGKSDPPKFSHVNGLPPEHGWFNLTWWICEKKHAGINSEDLHHNSAQFL